MIIGNIIPRNSTNKAYKHIPPYWKSILDNPVKVSLRIKCFDVYLGIKAMTNRHLIPAKKSSINLNTLTN